MKKLLFCFLVLCSFSSMAQKITDLPTATGRGAGSFIPVVQGAVTKKLNLDSIAIPAKNYTDSVKDTLLTRINSNQGQLGTKQANLISGLNLATINGLSLLIPNNITIAGASPKPLSKSIASNAGGIAIWNFDSSSTVVLTNEGTADLQITGSIPTGSTGILVFKQGAINIDLLKYNGSFLNIGRSPNKISIVGFYKRDNDFIFSIDTTASIVAAIGMFDPSSQLLFDSALTNLSYKAAVDNAIKGLKAITLAAGGTAWSKSILINGRAGTNIIQQSYNWRTPGLYNYVYNGSFNYAGQGTQFDGAISLTTNLNLNTVLTSITDVSVFTVLGTLPNPTTFADRGQILGTYSPLEPTALYISSESSTDFRYAFNAPVIVINTQPIGRFLVSYLDASTVNSYKNGTLLDSRAVSTFSAISNFQLTEGALNYNGTPQNFSSGRTDVTQIINSKLTVTEAQAIDAVWATYQTALNR